MASKVQTSCIATLVKAGKIEAATRIAVMANIEPGYEGNTQQGFFVHNAEYDARQGGMSKHQFAGGLAAMTKKGEYVPCDDPDYSGSFGYFVNKE